MHTVAVLAMPGVIAFDLATPIEVFSRARLPDGRAAYDVVVCGTSPVVTAGPVRLALDHDLSALDRADTVVVPGRSQPEEPVPDDALEALRRAHRAGTRLASICVGAFTLAEAGLLDGMSATTHWLAAPAFAARFPAVALDPDVLYIDHGRILTSAGAAAGLDLCLHMIRTDHGAAVAADASRLAVSPLHRDGGQAQFILRSLPGPTTASLEPVLAWLERNAHRPLTLEDIAGAAHISVRTLNRHFQHHTGHSPIQWLTGVRVRRAQELLETTDHTVDRIAAQVGFRSPTNFRNLFRRLTGVPPSAYRRTFRGGDGPTS